MSIDLRTYASGDTDYIAKMNANVADIEAAINALQAQVGSAGAGTALSTGQFLASLFNNADALIGPEAYKPTQGATTLSVAPGGMYLFTSQAVVTSLNTVSLNFVGQSAGTKYITIDGSGLPVIQSALGGGATYSVVWTGGAFTGTPVRIARSFFDTIEAANSRSSTALANSYDTLDLRLEAGELHALAAQDDAQEAIDTANEAKSMISNAVATTLQRFRKVGVTVDNTTGIKGAIQLDFEGVIVGWSVIADTAGILQVEVSKKSSSVPPAVPSIPNIVTDKISASAPIALGGAQSASSGASGVSTWSKNIDPWDVMQFNVISVSTITRATLYVRIQEALPESFVMSSFVPAASVANAPLLIALV